MTNTPESTPTSDGAELDYDSTVDSAGRRGEDDRRGTVNPAEDPAPSSPPPDQDAVRKGEETLERVKPY